MRAFCRAASIAGPGGFLNAEQLEVIDQRALRTDIVRDKFAIAKAGGDEQAPFIPRFHLEQRFRPAGDEVVRAPGPRRAALQ